MPLTLTPKLKPGDTLWYVPDKRYARYAFDPSEVVIEAVGRKWITVVDSQRRFNVETLEADGGDFFSPGRAYVDRETYEKRARVERLWGRLKRDIPNDAPEGVTAEDIFKARALLGLQWGDRT